MINSGHTNLQIRGVHAEPWANALARLLQEVHGGCQATDLGQQCCRVWTLGLQESFAIEARRFQDVVSVCGYSKGQPNTLTIDEHIDKHMPQQMKK